MILMVAFPAVCFKSVQVAKKVLPVFLGHVPGDFKLHLSLSARVLSLLLELSVLQALVSLVAVHNKRTSASAVILGNNFIHGQGSGSWSFSFSSNSANPTTVTWRRSCFGSQRQARSLHQITLQALKPKHLRAKVCRRIAWLPAALCPKLAFASHKPS